MTFFFFIFIHIPMGCKVLTYIHSSCGSNCMVRRWMVCEYIYPFWLLPAPHAFVFLQLAFPSTIAREKLIKKKNQEQRNKKVWRLFGKGGRWKYKVSAEELGERKGQKSVVLSHEKRRFHFVIIQRESRKEKRVKGRSWDHTHLVAQSSLSHADVALHIFLGGFYHVVSDEDNSWCYCSPTRPRPDSWLRRVRSLCEPCEWVKLYTEREIEREERDSIPKPSDF